MIEDRQTLIFSKSMYEGMIKFITLEGLIEEGGGGMCTHMQLLHMNLLLTEVRPDFDEWVLDYLFLPQRGQAYTVFFLFNVLLFSYLYIFQQQNCAEFLVMCSDLNDLRCQRSYNYLCN